MNRLCMADGHSLAAITAVTGESVSFDSSPGTILWTSATISKQCSL